VEAPQLFDPTGRTRLVSIPSDTLYIAKEIAAMILASEPVKYADYYPALRHFVMDARATFQPNFTVRGFLVPDSPQAGTITRFHGRVDTFAPGYGFVGGEISHFPFGFVYATQIGSGYGIEGLTDLTRWFTTASDFDRNNDAASLYCRITGVDSIQCGIGRERKSPQIDYLGPPA